MGVSVNNKFKTNQTLVGSSESSKKSSSTALLVKKIAGGIELSLLTVLVLSFISYIFCPLIRDQEIAQKYLQILTALFVTYECIIKTYFVYTDLLEASYGDSESSSKKSTDLKNKSFFDQYIGGKYLGWIKLGVFMIAFSAAILGLVPINIAVMGPNEDLPAFSISSLLISAGLGIFSFDFTDILLYSRSDYFVTFCFGILYLSIFIISTFMYFKGTNIVGLAVISSLVLKCLELGCKYARDYKNGSSKKENDGWSEGSKYIAILVMGALTFSSFLGLFFLKVPLAIPQNWSFLKKVTA